MSENFLQTAGPQSVLSKLFKRVPKYITVTFAVAFILCVLVHHQAYSKMLLNLDNLGHMFGSDYGVMSGRWLLPAVLKLEGDLCISWIIGLIAAFFLSLSVCIVVSMTRIRSAVGCIAAAAIMTSFPTIASNNFYMFSADAYMLSLFLACLGAFFTVRYRFGFIPGCVCLILSAGIYQAFLGVGAALLVGSLIFELLDGEKSAWEVLKKGVGYFLMLVAVIVVYYAIVKLTSRTTGLVDYKGISSMGFESLKDLRWTLVSAFTFYFRFFVKDGMSLHSAPAVVAFVLMMAAALIMGLSVIRRRSLGWKKVALLIFLLMCFLPAANLTRLMAPMAQLHMLMIYGVCLVPVAAVALGDYVYAMREAREAKGPSVKLDTACVWLVVCSAIILSANYAVKDNEAYFKSEMIERESVAYGNRILSAAQQAEGYEAGMPLVLVGTKGVEPLATKGLENVIMTGCFEMDSVIRCYTYDRFLNYYCGWTDDVYIEGDIDDEKVTERYAAMDEVRDMPVYPNQGSVRVIDGAVVVKISEHK